MSVVETEVAWAAGVFEGEGFIGIYAKPKRKGGGTTARRLRMSMSDEDVVRRFQAVVGCGNVIRYEPKNPKWKPMWRWDCSRWDDISAVLEAFLPYFGERRAGRARELLANPSIGVGKYQATKTHCIRGHEFTPENTYSRPGHVGRHCRICKRLKDQSYYKPRVRKLATHCKRGHEFTDENTYVPPSSTSRHCRACKNEAKRERRASRGV